MGEGKVLVGRRKKFHPALPPQKSRGRAPKIQGRWIKAMGRIPSIDAGFRAIGRQKSKNPRFLEAMKRLWVWIFAEAAKDHTGRRGNRMPVFIYFFGFLDF